MKPLLFVSGWGFNEHIFDPLTAHFDGTEIACVNGNTILDPEAFIACLEHFSEPPIVVGWSMGGMRAIEAAQAVPEKTAALVLLSTTLKFCSDDEYLWGVPPANLRAMKIGLRRDPEKTLEEFSAQVCQPQSTGILPGDVLFSDPSVLSSGLDYLAKTDLRDGDFSRMPPSIVYHGKKDSIISSNAGRMLSQRLQSANLMRYNGIGHALPLIQPMILAANITFYLGKIGV
jgi:pimeloyl-ACP methyl ester carboxylesterase